MEAKAGIKRTWIRENTQFIQELGLRKFEESDYDNTAKNIEKESNSPRRKVYRHTGRRKDQNTQQLIRDRKDSYHSEESYSDTLTGGTSTETITSESVNYKQLHLNHTGNIEIPEGIQTLRSSMIVDNPSPKEKGILTSTVCKHMPGRITSDHNKDLNRHQSSMQSRDKEKLSPSRSISTKNAQYMTRSRSVSILEKDDKLMQKEQPLPSKAVSSHSLTSPSCRSSSVSNINQSPSGISKSGPKAKSYSRLDVLSAYPKRKTYRSSPELYLKPQKMVEIERLQKAGPVKSKLSRTYGASTGSVNMHYLSGHQHIQDLTSLEGKAVSDRLLWSRQHMQDGKQEKVMWSRIHQRPESEGRLMRSGINHKSSSGLLTGSDMTDSSGFVSGHSQMSSIGSSQSTFSRSQQTFSTLHSAKTLSSFSQGSGSSKTLTGSSSGYYSTRNLGDFSQPSGLDIIPESYVQSDTERKLSSPSGMTNRNRNYHSRLSFVSDSALANGDNTISISNKDSLLAKQTKKANTIQSFNKSAKNNEKYDNLPNAHASGKDILSEIEQQIKSASSVDHLGQSRRQWLYESASDNQINANIRRAHSDIISCNANILDYTNDLHATNTLLNANRNTSYHTFSDYAEITQDNGKFTPYVIRSAPSTGNLDYFSTRSHSKHKKDGDIGECLRCGPGKELFFMCIQVLSTSLGCVRKKNFKLNLVWS